MEAIVARPSAGVAPVTRDAVAHSLEASQFLDVSVGQFAKVLMLIAPGRLLRLKGCQATQSLWVSQAATVE